MARKIVTKIDLLKYIFPKILFTFSIIILSKVFFLNLYPDFNAYYYNSQIWKNGITFINSHMLIPNYPPSVAILLSFLSIMPLEVAGKLWALLSIFFLLISIYLVFRIFNKRIFSPTGLTIISLIFLSFPVRFTLGMGQLNLLVLLFVTLAFYFFMKGKDTYSGISLGIAIMLKLFPLILIFYFILLRKYKVLFYAALIVIIFLFIPYLFIKSEINTSYWKHIPDFFSTFPSDYYNQALSGLLARQIESPFYRELLKVVISIIFIILSFWVIIKKRKSSFSRKTLEFGYLITLNVFINGYAWQHHFVWIILPFLVVFFYLKNNKLGINLYFYLGISYVLVALNFKNPSSLPTILQSHVFFGSLLLWLMYSFLLLKYDA